MNDWVVAIVVLGVMVLSLAAVFWFLTWVDKEMLAIRALRACEPRFNFIPQANITAYELAEILRVCQKPHIGPAYQWLPEKLRRHFVLSRRPK